MDGHGLADRGGVPGLRTVSSRLHETVVTRPRDMPPRCRITRRLREQAASEVADRRITPAGAARHAGISWPPTHDAFAAAADRVLGGVGAENRVTSRDLGIFMDQAAGPVPA